jgi:hypothetical protein
LVDSDDDDDDDDDVRCGRGSFDDDEDDDWIHEMTAYLPLSLYPIISYPSIHPLIHPSIHQSIHLFIHPSCLHVSSMPTYGSM